jgi:lysophospholipase L1-like esterase
VSYLEPTTSGGWVTPTGGGGGGGASLTTRFALADGTLIDQDGRLAAAPVQYDDGIEFQVTGGWSSFDVGNWPRLMMRARRPDGTPLREEDFAGLAAQVHVIADPGVAANYDGLVACVGFCDEPDPNTATADALWGGIYFNNLGTGNKLHLGITGGLQNGGAGTPATGAASIHLRGVAAGLSRLGTGAGAQGVYVHVMGSDASRNVLQLFSRFDAFSAPWGREPYVFLAVGNVVATAATRTVRINAGYSCFGPADPSIQWAGGSGLKLATFGDSITLGTGSFLSYRPWLNRLIEDGDKPSRAYAPRVKCLGTVGRDSTNVAHNGVGGATSASLLAALPGYLATIASVDGPPTDAIVMIGINDIVAVRANALIVADITAIRDLLVAAGVHVTLSKLTPTTNGTYNAAILVLNASIAGLADANTTISDPHTGFVTGTMLFDVVHPNELGDQHIASKHRVAMLAAGRI